MTQYLGSRIDNNPLLHLRRTLCLHGSVPGLAHRQQSIASLATDVVPLWLSTWARASTTIHCFTCDGRCASMAQYLGSRIDNIPGLASRQHAMEIGGTILLHCHLTVHSQFLPYIYKIIEKAVVII
ncbi:uncharacterized protein F5891DRAFT_1176172 [Suillus fuscotomentosus]|uniref:Uncharacterized protein n=1 Tax=Suillus fuscotomentosus TaxID=1912939 RepID=A0AAD4DUL3_9AGAM|nr:uncharacterized protein F5891DRAFT_1176172 [Suillus fuscotomentosus]KAG1894152.1 hypothetical protein F5891DRAFT_1176172 [Suillus fuscotomentosus]